MKKSLQTAVWHLHPETTQMPLKSTLTAILLFCLGLLTFSAQAQPLAAGDIAIVGVNTDVGSFSEEITILTLATIPSGTVIYFSDYFWDNTNTRWGNDGRNGTFQNEAEGIIRWTPSSSVASGTVLRMTLEGGRSGSGILPQVSGLPGTLTVVEGFTNTNSGVGPMGNNGDNIFIYQSTNNGLTPNNWVFGWNNSLSTSVTGSWQNTNSPASGNLSMLPTSPTPGLTNGSNAVSFAQNGSGSATNPHYDNLVYNIGSLRSGTKAALLSAICTSSNWVGDDNTAYDIAPTSTYFSGANAFFVGGCSTPTAYNVTGGGSFCSGGAGLAIGLDNSQTNVNYQLKRDGGNVGGTVPGLTGSPITFGNQTVAGNYTVTATTVSGGCTNTMTGSVNITVNPNVTPSVSITANPGNTILLSTSVTFTAVPVNGGASPSYQWKKNGNNVGTNQTTYTDAGLVSGDIITCVLTSNAACASPTTATSNSITMTVNCNCSPVCSSIPLAPGLYTAAVEFTDAGGWTYYCTGQGELLLGLKKGATGINVSPNQVTVNVGSPLTQYITQGTGFVTNQNGAIVMNRTWNVSPTQQPATPIEVRTFFLNDYLTAINTSLTSLGQTPLSGFNQMWFYKATSGGAHASVSSVTSANLYLNDVTPSLTKWALGSYVNGYYAEFLTSSFSGGGGGGASGGSSPFPINLLSFTGEKIDNIHHLAWTSSSEQNASHIEVEHSQNGTSFQGIGLVQAVGESSTPQFYTFDNTKFSNGTNFYRLKLVDKDGAFDYSNIVEIKENGNAIAVFPNPSKSGIFTFIGKNVTSSDITITNTLGQNIQVKAENNQVDLSQMPNGIYYVKVVNEIDVLRLVKE